MKNFIQDNKKIIIERIHEKKSFPRISAFSILKRG